MINHKDTKINATRRMQRITLRDLDVLNLEPSWLNFTSNLQISKS